MKLFHEHFTLAAAAHPKRVALCDAAGLLTYAQVDKASNNIANVLFEHGLRTGEAVAVFVPHQKEVMVCALAILKAGGVYLPFDEQYPNERLTYMLRDANARFILADRQLYKSRKASFEERTVLFIDDATKTNCKSTFVVCEQSTDASAMILYTSGTTGNPKGVVHRHALLCHMNDWVQNHKSVAFDKSARMAIMSGFTFVATNAFMFGVLLAGGCLFIAPKQVKYSTDVLYEYLCENKITHIFMPSSLAANMIEDYDMSHTAIFAGGEKLRNFMPKSKDAQLYNFYGSTELATIFSTRIYGTEQPIPVGKLTPGAEVLVVDDSLNSVDDGCVGELLVNSSWLSLGYLNLEELTKKNWVEIAGKVYFRTGDRVRKGENDLFYILGRIDNMVKLRGFRIETGEVETQISKAFAALKLPDTSIVVCKKTFHSTEHLCCYYEANKAFDSTKITDELKKFLPDYMIPDLWLNVDKMPRNANGKVERAKLPQPRLPIHVLGAISSELELRVVEAASLVLSLQGAIDPACSFVELGGSSLSAMELSSALGKQGISVSATQILAAASLHEVAHKATVKYERLWTAEEFEGVKQRFASHGEKIEEVLPLSPKQDDLICYGLTHPDFSTLEKTYLFATESTLRAHDVRCALDSLAANFPKLKAAVAFRDVSVFQCVITNRKIPLEVLKETNSTDFSSLQAVLNNDVNESAFDLERSALFRVVLVERKCGGSWLFVVVNKFAYSEQTLRKLFLHLMLKLKKSYSSDAELSAWVELLHSAVKMDDDAAAAKSQGMPQVAFDVSGGTHDVCVYSSDAPKKVFFVHTGNTGASAYYPLAQRIKADFSFVAFEPYNLYHTHDIKHGISSIAAKYIETMKGIQPSGPYVLGGWCYGGVVAHEMACQLESAGEVVEHLIMLDAHCLSNPTFKKLAKPMQASTDRRYFETCPLFAELRENGMLEAVINNAAQVVEDINSHNPKFFHGSTTYFKPKCAPAQASGDVLKYWTEMMKLKAGNYENYCEADKLEVVVVPGEHDTMMSPEALDVIVPKLYDVL